MLPSVSLLQMERFCADEVGRAQRIRRAWSRYHGEWPKPLRKTKSDPGNDDSLTINFAKLLVNKCVAMMFGYELGVEVDGGQSPEAQRWLNEALHANSWMSWLHELGVAGGVAGHGFVRLQLPNEASYGHPYPRMVLWAPADVAVRWRPDDYKVVESYTYQWHGIQPGTAKPIAQRQVVLRDGTGWLIRDEESVGDSPAWIQTGEVRWPYAWCPVIHCQNLPCPHEFWGLSDLEDDILRVNAALNFAVSNLTRILRVHAHPKTWGKGFEQESLEIAVDSTIVLPSEKAELHNLEMLSDLSSVLDWIRSLREMLHSLARIPEVATGRMDNIGVLSGLAMQVLYGPVVELVRTKRITYGELLHTLCRRLLEMGGQGAERAVTLQWPALLPHDPQAEAQTAALHQQLGVSQDTLLRRLGYDADSERAKRGREPAPPEPPAPKEGE